MSSDYTLAPLDCPSCGAGIRAEGEDVVYYCTACRNGYRFDDPSGKLTAVEVSFVSVPNQQVDLYLPFWLLPAQVRIEERTAKGGSFSGLMRLFLAGGEESASTDAGTFAVPAFNAPLSAITELTCRYTEALPGLGEKLGERLVGGCYGVDDARKLAHFALIASEVGKPDTLTQFRYEIEFGPERLLGVPFVRRGEGVVDALFQIAL
jgi:hypothetical protein